MLCCVLSRPAGPRKRKLGSLLLPGSPLGVFQLGLTGFGFLPFRLGDGERTASQILRLIKLFFSQSTLSDKISDSTSIVTRLHRRWRARTSNCAEAVLLLPLEPGRNYLECKFLHNESTRSHFEPPKVAAA